MPNSAITVDVAPGYYTEDQIINISFGDQVKEISINKNGRPPSISRYLAYDTLSSPQPFIAITEDGAGRVVYDGSFPKMYNQYRGRTGGMNYISNALEWIADPKRPRRILFLGDVVPSGSYSIKNSGSTGFLLSINQLINNGGWSGSVIKTRGDYPGGLIDARFTELNQYAAIFVVSSGTTTTTVYPAITEECIDDIVRYRESGGGIFIITDSAEVLGTYEDAYEYATSGRRPNTPYCYASTAIRIAVRFGAWFSGLLNRPNIPISHIRQNWGDHPLWDGISDSDYLTGGSDATINVTSDPTQPPSDLQYHATEGLTTINIMAILHDGTMVPHKLEYHVVNSATLFHIKGEDYGHSQIVNIGADNYIDMGLIHMGVDIAMEADIFLDEVKIGTASKEMGSPVIWTPLNGDSNRVYINNNSTISLVYTNPIGYRASIYISRKTVPYFEVEDLIYPKYDEFLGNLLVGIHTSPARLEKSAGIRRDIIALPSIIRYSKDNLNRIYGDMEPTYVVGVAQHVSGSIVWVGTTWGHASDSRTSGTIFPNDEMGGINSTDTRQLDLRLVSRTDTLSPQPIAIYMDSIGPLYLSDVTVGGNGPHMTLYYSNGVTNVYQYLQNRIGQHVEFRFLY